MSDRLANLFNDYDRGRISRRLLLQALGVAAVIRPISAFAQGSCAGTPRAGTPLCDPTLAKAPFAPTGWKTVWLDHFSMQAADYPKEAAYFATLMNWKIRSDDGTKALLDIGDGVGGFLIRGGYQPPAPPAAPPAGAATGAGAGAAGAAGAGRAGGRGGGGRGPARVIVDGFCWGIEPWDTKKVEAELTKRGLNPVADHNGKDFQSFHVVDPGGFDLQISNGNAKNRRSTAANGKMMAPAPFEPTAWKTVWLDHISFQCVDYKTSAAFYNALLGWKLGEDEGSQNECEIGNVGNVLIRGTNMSPIAVEARAKAAADAAAAGTAPTGRGGGGGGARTKSSIDHIAFGIAPWDPDAVGAELEKRGLSHSVDTGGHGSTPEALRAANYQSYHTQTPNGFTLQISKTTMASRNVR
jgi:catechol 2,3-dioxygenase-like lactoylglutathione lyase family enzyme